MSFLGGLPESFLGGGRSAGDGSQGHSARGVRAHLRRPDGPGPTDVGGGGSSGLTCCGIADDQRLRHAEARAPVGLPCGPFPAGVPSPKTGHHFRLRRRRARFPPRRPGAAISCAARAPRREDYSCRDAAGGRIPRPCRPFPRWRPDYGADGVAAGAFSSRKTPTPNGARVTAPSVAEPSRRARQRPGASSGLTVTGSLA
jgi:hypothetical protein